METFTEDLNNEINNLHIKIPKIIVRIFEILCQITGLNFLAFLVGYLVLGGEAVGGMEQDGKYYLNMQGNLTEVSELVFLYSKSHVLSVLWSFAVIFSPAIYIVSKVALKRFLGSGS